MPTSLLEIVDLGDGEIVLRRAEDVADDAVEGVADDAAESNAAENPESSADARDRAATSEPLVTIRFSDETRVYIMDQSMEVAKAMIQAGIQAAAQLAEQADIEMEVEPAHSAPPTLH